MDETEVFFTCPHCWQEVSILVDLSAGGQAYVEDCEVCCNPLEVRYGVEDGEIAWFEATPAQ